ncbi:MAG TPA: globin [Candidatus Dormibacteraeota bacterium]
MSTVYDEVGEEGFRRLVADFYAAVATDPVLRPLYPKDMESSKEHLRLFLVQYWGGPGTYSEQRGHPRLRMRHMPFAIGRRERDAWFQHMTAAVRSLELRPEVEAALLEYFEGASLGLMNRVELT